MQHHPRHIAISEFNYGLPEERIAKFPLPQRDRSKLLIFDQGSIRESVYTNLPDILPSNTTLIFNNTRVVFARLFFRKNTGGRIEIFCLEPDSRYPDIQTAMQQHGSVYWKCLVGGASKWKPGTTISLGIDSPAITITAESVARESDHQVIRFSWNADMSFAEILHHAGNLPLPPYLNRTAESSDHDRYQTIYAEPEGSVAAPTAGLHFSPELFRELDHKGIRKIFVTLHVGAGTFKPVKAETLEGHEMHAECLETDPAAIADILNRKRVGKIVCVGTTSLRTTESLYWMGVKALKKPDIGAEELEVKQWDPYETEASGINAEAALNALIHWINKNKLRRLVIKTQILIAPGYKLRIADGLITNFHQPQSTLLLLIAAVVGDDWKKIYRYALEHDFRFLSYGDGSLLWNQT